MAIDLIRMRLRVRKPLGITDPLDSDLLDSDIDEYLNMAFWEVQDKFPFEEKEVIEQFGTMVGQKLYANPFSTEAVKYYSVIDPVSGVHTPLDYMEPMEYERIANDTVLARGIPQKYMPEAGNVTLWPTPDQQYTIVRRRNVVLADLAATNKNLVIPQIWIEILIYGAVWRAKIDFGDLERSAAIQAHQVALIQSVTAVEEKQKGDPRLTQARNEQTVQQQLKTINDTLALKLKQIDLKTQVGIKKFDSETARQVKDVDNTLQLQLKELENILQLGIKTLDIALQPKLKKLDDAQTLALKELDAKLQPQLKDVDTDLQLDLKGFDNVLQFNLGKLDAVLKKGLQEVGNVLELDLKTLEVAQSAKVKKLDNEQIVELKRLELDLQPRLKKLDNRIQHIIIAFENVLQLDLKGLNNDLQLSLKRLDNLFKRDYNLLERESLNIRNVFSKGVVDDFLSFWGSSRQNAGLDVRGRDYNQRDDDPTIDRLIGNWPTIIVNSTAALIAAEEAAGLLNDDGQDIDDDE